MRRICALICALLALCLCCCACGNTERLEYNVMSTRYKISLGDQPDNGLLDAMHEHVTMMDFYLSAFETSSDIYRINHAQGQTTTVVLPRLLPLLSDAIALSIDTDGAFSPFLWPLIECWGIYPSSTVTEWVPPAESDIAAALENSDPGEVTYSLQDNTITLSNPAAGLEFGAIAKGAVVDDWLGMMRDAGLTYGLADFGGTIGLLGVKEDGTPWRIGLQDPTIGETGMFAGLNLTDTCVSTSGNYQRYYRYKDQLYGHILDPRTGRPAQNELISVSIIGPSATVCDALSTAVFVLGRQDGLQLLQKPAFSQYQAVLVDSQNQVTITPGLKDVFELQSPNFTLVS